MTKETPGPESPARKADWLDPVSLIFCDPRWQYVGKEPKRRYSCQPAASARRRPVTAHTMKNASSTAATP
jgi:hypothetical protein